jgi:hypothetical protein
LARRKSGRWRSGGAGDFPGTVDPVFAVHPAASSTRVAVTRLDQLCSDKAAYQGCVSEVVEI